MPRISKTDIMGLLSIYKDLSYYRDLDKFLPGIFSNRVSCLRSETALAMEQSEDWLTDHRYLDMQVLDDVPELTSTMASFEVVESNVALTFK